MNMIWPSLSNLQNISNLKCNLYNRYYGLVTCLVLVPNITGHIVCWQIKIFSLIKIIMNLHIYIIRDTNLLFGQSTLTSERTKVPHPVGQIRIHA
jgi:hypothetical protein